MNMARKGFDIFEEDMAQTIYGNYLGIFGMMEIWVASQPRADRVIPLKKKEYSQEKEYWDWLKMDMKRSWNGFRGWQATREEKSRVILPGSKTTKPRKSKTRPKSKEKEMGKIQGVTHHLTNSFPNGLHSFGTRVMRLLSPCGSQITTIQVLVLMRTCQKM